MYVYEHVILHLILKVDIAFLISSDYRRLYLITDFLNYVYSVVQLIKGLV